MGVPAGFNVGFEYALGQDSDYVLMLNNDTAAAPNFIDALVSEAESDQDIGVVMPKVVYYDHPDQLWAMGGRYRRFPPAIVMRDARHGDVGDLPEYLEFAPSCALLIRRKAFVYAGLFDPGYLYYFDDWDFSKRVRAHGLKIRYQPEAVLRHKVSATIKKEARSAQFWKTFAASGVRYYRRHGRPAWLSVLVHVGFLFMREIVFNGNWQFRRSFWEGARSEYRKPLGPIPWTSETGEDRVQAKRGNNDAKQ
jgi:GT2 family glycosyltransferase